MKAAPGLRCDSNLCLRISVASLLNCLHQLRQENQRLEEHILMLTARRDQLLAVNARLSLPLIPVNAVLSANTTVNNTSNTANSQGTSPEGRSPRINNYLPQDAHNTSHSQVLVLVVCLLYVVVCALCCLCHGRARICLHFTYDANKMWEMIKVGNDWRTVLS